jgi:hypothetical protein
MVADKHWTDDAATDAWLSWLPKIDPAVAVEVMREVIGSADTKKKRAFLGAFIERVTVNVENVTVDYARRLC